MSTEEKNNEEKLEINYDSIASVYEEFEIFIFFYLLTS
jgi:hypothetical protein